MLALDSFAYNENSEAMMMSEIRRYHPLFKKLSFQAARMLFRYGKILKLQPAQKLSKEGTQEKKMHIILYGRILIKANDCIIGVADYNETIGEESFLTNIISDNIDKNAISEGKAGVLSFDKGEIEELKIRFLALELKADYIQVKMFFKKSYGNKEILRRKK